MFTRIRPTPEEVHTQLAGDTVLPSADVVMDRAFTLDATPEEVWPWFVQLGKNRAGWYFPRYIERFIVPKKRALRHIDASLLNTKVGDIIDDWGGKNGYFELVSKGKPRAIVYKSTRGKLSMSWAITLRPDAGSTRVHIRLRLAPVRTKWLAEMGGGFFDAVTIAGLRAGLAERLADNRH